MPRYVKSIRRQAGRKAPAGYFQPTSLSSRRYPKAKSAGEMKIFDTVRNATLATVDTTWAGCEADPTTFLTLLAPTVGAAQNQRIGREVKVHAIKIRGTLLVPTQATQSVADAPTPVRVILFQDTQTNAAQVQAETLMTGVATGAVTILSFQNPDNFGRFKVLKDKMFQISDLNLVNETGATGGLVQAGKCIPFKIMHKFREPVSVRFNAVNGGTVADIVDNSFHVAAACTSVIYGTVMAYNCRVTYKE